MRSLHHMVPGRHRPYGGIETLIDAPWTIRNPSLPTWAEPGSAADSGKPVSIAGNPKGSVGGYGFRLLLPEQKPVLSEEEGNLDRRTKPGLYTVEPSIETTKRLNQTPETSQIRCAHIYLPSGLPLSPIPISSIRPPSSAERRNLPTLSVCAFTSTIRRSGMAFVFKPANSTCSMSLE